MISQYEEKETSDAFCVTSTSSITVYTKRGI